MSEMHQTIHGNATDDAERCPHKTCTAKWHGLPAGSCPTSFVDKYANEEGAA